MTDSVVTQSFFQKQARQRTVRPRLALQRLKTFKSSSGHLDIRSYFRVTVVVVTIDEDAGHM